MDDDLKQKLGWNETSISKLLKDHPGCYITIKSMSLYKNIEEMPGLIIKVVDANRGIAYEYLIDDIQITRGGNSFFYGLKIGYNELFKPFDERLKEDTSYGNK